MAMASIKFAPFTLPVAKGKTHTMAMALSSRKFLPALPSLPHGRAIYLTTSRVNKVSSGKSDLTVEQDENKEANMTNDPLEPSLEKNPLESQLENDPVESKLNAKEKGDKMKFVLSTLFQAFITAIFTLIADLTLLYIQQTPTEAKVYTTIGNFVVKYVLFFINKTEKK